MNPKKIILGFILILILSVMGFEEALRIQRGAPPLESNLADFKEGYEEIYERFFKKIRLPAGKVVYKTQRDHAIEEVFSADKIKGVKRIFILGGSVARPFGEGVGERNIKELLENLIPGEKFEIIGCGVGGYDSYRVSLIHKEILSYDPDFIILLSGNNEYWDPVRVNLWAYKVNWLFRNLWIYRDSQEKFRAWVENRRISRKPFKEKRLINYENNLRKMILWAKKRKIPMILCALPANFRDCPPRGFPLWQDKQFFLAKNALDKRKFEEAVKGFKQFISNHPEDAFGEYFLAQCYDNLGNYAQAQSHYLRALDLDANPGDRCPPERNEVIRRLCAQEGSVLVDLEKTFIEAAPHGLVGNEFFLDGCHWWRNYSVFEKVARAIESCYKSRLKKPSAFLAKARNKGDGYLDFSAITIKELKSRGLEKVVNMIFGLVSSNQEVCLVQERAISFLQIAYQWNQELFESSAFFKSQMLNEFSTNQWIQGWLPEDFEEKWPVIFSHTGEALRRLGMYVKAVEYFNKAIGLDSKLCFPYLGRGLAYYKIGQIDKAKRDFDEMAKRSCQQPLVGYYRELLGI